MAEYMDESEPPSLADQPGEDADLIDLETETNRPLSWRKRWAQIFLLLAAAVVALGIFWDTNAPGKPAHPLAATPPVQLPTLLIYSNVNTGIVTLNGKQQPGQIPMLLTLRPQSFYIFDITLNTPPFLPQSCQVHLYQNGNVDTDNHCHASSGADVPMFISTRNPVIRPTYEIDFSFTLNDLPPVQQNKVTALLTRTLTVQQNLTVPAGSYFATGIDAAGKIINQRASAPLQASVTVAPFTPQQPLSTGPCVAFVCTLVNPALVDSNLTGYQWDILAVVAVHWRFVSAVGALISSVRTQPTNTIKFSLSYDAAGGWSVLQPPPSPGSVSISTQLARTFSIAGQGTLEQLAGGLEANADASITDDNGAAGCWLLLYRGNVNQGMYLWRFGVLLTVDPTSQAAHPELPMAPSQEINAVQ